MKYKSFINYNITFLKSVDSTNNYVANLLKSNTITSGTVIMADIQTEGRGQRGKQWHSDASNSLLFSIAADLNLWKIKNVISLNHITSLAVFSFLAQKVENVKIKWPNDIMVNDKKITGILIENLVSSKGIKSVIGIGMNCNQKEFPVERATSLLLETGKSVLPSSLLEELLAQIDYFLNLYQKKGEIYIHTLYNENLWKKGILFDFESNQKKFKGEILETTKQGALKIKNEEGNEIEFSNGEVKY